MSTLLEDYYANVNKQQTPQPQQKQSGGFNLGGILQSLANPFIQTGKTLLGGGVEATRLGLSPFTNYDKAAQGDALQTFLVNLQTSKNPYLSEGGAFTNVGGKPALTLEQANKDPLGAILGQTKASAGVASWAVPFGKGANFATKALLPGAAVGGAQSFSDQNSTPESVLQGALAGGATAGVFRGATNALGKVPGLVGKGSNKLSDQLVKGQYNVLPKDAAKLKIGQTTKELADYGFRNIKDVAKVAPKVTGDTGVITDLTRRAVGEAQPVELGGLAKLAKNLVADKPVIEQNAGNKFVNLIKRSISSVGGENVVGGNPTKVHDLIMTLEGEAADLSAGNASKADKALSSVYKGMANEIRDRLYQGAGADKALVSKVMTAADLNKLAQVSPKLAEKAANVKTVGQLRSLAAPFVKGSQLAEKTTDRASNKILSLRDILSTGGGGLLGGGIPGAAAGLALSKASESPAVLSGLSGALAGVGNVANKVASTKMNPLLEQILGQGASRVGAGLSQPQDQSVVPTSPEVSGNQTPDSYNNQSYDNQSGGIIPQIGIDQGQSANPYPLENYVSDIQRDPRNAALYKEIFNQYQSQYEQAAPKQKNLSGATAKDLALTTSGLRSVEQLASILNSDKNILTKRLFPAGLLSREYDTIAFNVADTVLRLRTGAVAPEAEIRRYMEQVIPRFGDDDKTVQTKLKRIRTDLSETAGLLQSTTGSADQSNALMQYLSGGQ